MISKEDILKVMKESCHCEDERLIKGSHNLFDSGVLDSFSIVLFISQLESDLGIDIASLELIPQDFFTLDSIFDLLDRN